jgi:hypothetical protein
MQSMPNLKHLSLSAMLTLSMTLVGCFTDSEDHENHNHSSSSALSSSSGNSSSSVTAPKTYNFGNVNFGGQKERLEMLAELKAYITTANANGVVIDSVKMAELFANRNNPYANTALNTLSKRIQDKTFAADTSMYLQFFGLAAAASQSTTEASEGKAGRIARKVKGGQVLVDANGREIVQLVEKGLMGSFLMYQILGPGQYLSDDKLLPADHQTVVDGEGTKRQHYWDEGYGYFAGHIQFPDSVGKSPWANYAKQQEANVSTASRILEAFIAGRAALPTGSMDSEALKKAQASVTTELERLAVIMSVKYLKDTKKNLGSDNGEAFHALSEGWGFINSLRYISNGKVGPTKSQEALDLIGENFWKVSPEKLDAAIQILVQAYGLEQAIVDKY